jgi:hypothetical protein
MNNKKIFTIASIAIVILLVFGAGFVAFRNRNSNQSGSQNLAQNKAVNNNSTNSHPTPAETPAQTDVIQNQAAGSEVKDLALSSENYKIDQVQFGGDVTLAVADSESLPIAIDNVRTETFTNSKGDASQASITWKSNKLTISDVEYSKSGEGNAKTIHETNFGFGHSSTLSNLEPGTAYMYRIVSTDHWGNKSTSDYYGFYTSSKATSVFDLITQKFKEIFGWAIK